MKRYARTLNAQRWMISLDFSHLTRARFAPIWAFLISQRGQYDTFQYVLPNPLYTPQGSGSGGAVNGNFGSPAEQQTGRSVYTDGWSNSITVVKAGDFLKYASHTKVYMATADALSDSSGLAQLSFDPALVQAVSDGDAITLSSVPFTVSLARDELAFGLGVGSMFRLQQVQLVESL